MAFECWVVARQRWDLHTYCVCRCQTQSERESGNFWRSIKFFQLFPTKISSTHHARSSVAKVSAEQIHGIIFSSPPSIMSTRIQTTTRLDLNSSELLHLYFIFLMLVMCTLDSRCAFIALFILLSLFRKFFSFFYSADAFLFVHFAATAIKLSLSRLLGTLDSCNLLLLFLLLLRLCLRVWLLYEETAGIWRCELSLL